MAKLKLAKNLAWCDLETTGLHPETGAILEVGVIITDRDLNELTRESSVVQFDLGSTDLQIDDYLRDKMHKDNGLWDECAASEVAIEELDQVFPELLRDYNAVGGPLCGNTPSFDRAWLQLHMPQMFRCFSHQHLDVTSLGLIGALLGVPGDPGPAGHRSLDDLDRSIRLLREGVSALIAAGSEFPA